MNEGSEVRDNKPNYEVKWTGKFPIPALGDRVNVTVNGIGCGTVEGFFTAYATETEGYQGVCIRLDVPLYNEKLIPIVRVFGAECSPTKEERLYYPPFVEAVAVAREAYPKDFVERIRNAWYHGNYEREGIQLAEYSGQLQQLRNGPDENRRLLDWFSDRKNYKGMKVSLGFEGRKEFTMFLKTKTDQLARKAVRIAKTHYTTPEDLRNVTSELVRHGFYHFEILKCVATVLNQKGMDSDSITTAMLPIASSSDISRMLGEIGLIKAESHADKALAEMETVSDSPKQGLK